MILLLTFSVNIKFATLAFEWGLAVIILRVSAKPTMDAFGQVAVSFSDLTKSLGFYYVGVPLNTWAD